MFQEEQALAKEALALVTAKLKAEKEKELDDDDSSGSPGGVSNEGSLNWISEVVFVFVSYLLEYVYAAGSDHIISKGSERSILGSHLALAGLEGVAARSVWF